MNMNMNHEEDFDGYRNEYQRAAAVSSLRRKADDKGKINKLLAEGFFVVAVEAPVFCPITDGIIGTALYFEACGRTADEALANGPQEFPDDAEYRPMLLRPPGASAPVAPVLEVADDGVPF